MASLSSFALHLLVLLLGISLTLTAAQYNISSMTGGAGCVLGSIPPLNCTSPAVVFVNFTASSPAWPADSTSCYIALADEAGKYIIAYGEPSSADPTNHSVAFALSTDGYQPALADQQLSAYVVCGTVVASPTFTAGPTFSLLLPPGLTSTSGCALTSPAIGAEGCQLTTDVLTVHGSSFTLLDGSVHVSVDGLESPAVVTVLDNSTLTLRLVQLQLPSASFFNTSVVSNLSFTSPQTNSVTLTFAPLTGPPVITQWYADVAYPSSGNPNPFFGCTIDNSTAWPSPSNYSDCYPSVYAFSFYGVTSVYIRGPNLFNAVISVYQPTLGSFPCFQNPLYPNSITYPYFVQCSLPAIAGNQPGMRYDIVVQTPSGAPPCHPPSHSRRGPSSRLWTAATTTDWRQRLCSLV